MEQEVNTTATPVEETPTEETNTTNEFELTEPREVEGRAAQRGKKIPVVHTLREASLAELQARDALRPYRSRDIGNEEEEVLADRTGTADVTLYEKLVIETKGYKLNVTPNQPAEDRAAALKSIPAQHKRSIIKDVTEFKSKPVYDIEDGVEEVFEWTENQTYRIRTELGTKGQFVVYTNIKEPSESQLEVYTGAVKFILEKGELKPVTKITVELEPAVKLFDQLVQSIEGFTYKGQPVDVTSAEQLVRVNGYFKRSVLDAVVKETQLDLGE
jgi:hypothetical protein